MSFWKRIFGRKKEVGGAENLISLFGYLGERGGENLAVIFNNMLEDGGGNLGMFLAAASQAQMARLAKWIQAADEPELVEAAHYISKANAYQLLNLLDWLENLNNSGAAHAARKSTAISPTPTHPDRTTPGERLKGRRPAQTVPTARNEGGEFVHFVCPACRKRLKANCGAIGKRAKCTGCEAILSIPGDAKPQRKLNLSRRRQKKARKAFPTHHEPETFSFQSLPEEQSHATHSNRATTPSVWSPLISGKISCRMPYQALERVMVFTSGPQNGVLKSRLLPAMLQDAVERPINDILGKLPVDIVQDANVVSRFLAGDGSIPDSVWDSISYFDAVVALQAKNGMYRVCVRPYEDPEIKQSVAILLLYNKLKV